MVWEYLFPGTLWVLSLLSLLYGFAALDTAKAELAKKDASITILYKNNSDKTVTINDYKTGKSKTYNGAEFFKKFTEDTQDGSK